LSQYYQVRKLHYKASKKLLRNIASQITVLLKIILRIPRVPFFFIWFADYHSFLPVFFSRLFRSRSVIVLGGYDVTYVPELKYGSFSNPIRRFCAAYSLRNAHYLLAVDPSLITEARSRVKSIKGEYLYVPTSFDSKQWYRTKEKENLVLTVGICDSFQRLKLKGIDIFIEIANLLPQYNFLIIGLQENMVRKLELPPNLNSRDHVSFLELRDFYSISKVYAQLSVREGLPSVVCEAMLCECITVGSGVNGIPTAIGDFGYILQDRNAQDGAKLIEKAMNSPASMGENARNRIMTLFNTERREKSILSILENY